LNKLTAYFYSNSRIESLLFRTRQPTSRSGNSSCTSEHAKDEPLHNEEQAIAEAKIRGFDPIGT